MLALFAAAVIAQAAPPVAINDCTVLQWQNAGTYPYWNPYFYRPLARSVPETDGIRISYVNRSNQVADRVAFIVDYRGQVDRIVDVGTFSPGAVINHTFGNFSGYAYLGPRPNVCRVAAVRFRNGAIWRSPRRQAMQ
jgi:hypothetical protein